MSNFDLTFCKVYVNVKGWPGINLGASHESGTYPNMYHLLAFLKVLVLDLLRVLFHPVKVPSILLRFLLSLLCKYVYKYEATVKSLYDGSYS